ncbi:hypothetical protein CDAR_73801 [Caerostris darwini]|uniref:Uncharacterized protein n=1 Tax=Caerostris darwini TaxID=1538125 RepID=A0AAV4MSG2_9ARAC|nr:hypothetical protein CDAR_73801 [Caerostris darwini]
MKKMSNFFYVHLEESRGKKLDFFLCPSHFQRILLGAAKKAHSNVSTYQPQPRGAAIFGSVFPVVFRNELSRDELSLVFSLSSEDLPHSEALSIGFVIYFPCYNASSLMAQQPRGETRPSAYW